MIGIAFKSSEKKKKNNIVLGRIFSWTIILTNARTKRILSKISMSVERDRLGNIMVYSSVGRKGVHCLRPLPFLQFKLNNTHHFPVVTLSAEGCTIRAVCGTLYVYA